MLKPRVMLYSARLSGHRQVFCDVFTEIFLELGYRVLLVAGVDGEPEACRWPYVRRWAAHPDVTVVDAARRESHRPDGGMTVPDIAALQRQVGVEVSVFICGDELRDDFRDIARGRAPRLAGHNIALFNQTWHWVGMDSPLCRGMSNRERLRAIRDRLGPFNQDRRFFEQDLLGQRILDCMLVEDERVAEIKGKPFVWLPDICRSLSPYENQASEAEYDELVPAYQDFLSSHRGLQILLYFGVASYHKGYDRLLQLAARDRDTAFVLCGTDDNRAGYPVNVQSIKARLKAEDRFFDAGRQVWGDSTVGAFFASVTRMVSTTRVYASSGTVLQAWKAGKPALVPGRGLLRYRTLRHGLGRVYNPRSENDLVEQWARFKTDPISQYADSLSAYITGYDRRHVLRSVETALECAYDSAAK